MTTQSTSATIRQIRTFLFDNEEFDGLFNGMLCSNKELRKILFDIDDQETEMSIRFINGVEIIDIF